MRYFRTDAGKLGVVKISSGGVVVQSFFARTGVQEYRMPDGSVRREYRPPEEVFATDTVASLRAAPVTLGHKGRITPKNWKQHAVGTVISGGKHTEKIDGEDWLVGEQLINDGDIIPKLGVEIQENSLGYDMTWDPTPGVTPDGKQYDGVQRGIIVNHNAVGRAGFARAGRAARLQMDGNEDVEFTEDQEEQMAAEATPKRMITVDGISCEYGSETHVSIVEKQAKAEKDRADGLAKDLEASKLETSKQTGRADTAETKLKDLQTKYDGEISPAAIDIKVKDSLALRDKVRKLVGDGYKFAGKSKRQILIDAAKGANKDKSFRDDDSEAVIGAYVDAVLDSRTDYRNRTEHNDGENTERNDGENPYAGAVAKANKGK